MWAIKSAVIAAALVPFTAFLMFKVESRNALFTTEKKDDGGSADDVGQMVDVSIFFLYDQEDREWSHFNCDMVSEGQEAGSPFDSETSCQNATNAVWALLGPIILGMGLAAALILTDWSFLRLKATGAAISAVHISTVVCLALILNFAHEMKTDSQQYFSVRYGPLFGWSCVLLFFSAVCSIGTAVFYCRQDSDESPSRPIINRLL